MFSLSLETRVILKVKSNHTLRARCTIIVKRRTIYIPLMAFVVRFTSPVVDALALVHVSPPSLFCSILVVAILQHSGSAPQ